MMGVMDMMDTGIHVLPLWQPDFSLRRTNLFLHVLLAQCRQSIHFMSSWALAFS
jgi:hypothetical protein